MSMEDGVSVHCAVPAGKGKILRVAEVKCAVPEI